MDVAIGEKFRPRADRGNHYQIATLGVNLLATPYWRSDDSRRFDRGLRRFFRFFPDFAFQRVERPFAGAGRWQDWQVDRNRRRNVFDAAGADGQCAQAMLATNTHQRGQVHGAFAGRELVQGQHQRGIAEEVRGLMRVCRQHGLRTLAIRASRIEDIAAAIAVDIPVLPPSGARERLLELNPVEAKKAPEKPPEPTIKPTRVITSPVRGGQQIYAQGGDLVIVSSVSPGAELLADGNIHVYGPMRGRALAGVKGDTKARIFCQQLSAELVSIAGQYKVSEDLRRDPLWGAGVQVSLSGEVLNIIRL